ncbi:E3 ubiquitin-protein ligase RHF2A [Camellia lanceoleosa]|uniref:E3 ubiquitin-protein ligase RHF2A n=1 Tax=Camellia lanceoleosa TaxID=1840588 RepID=A0ACC0HKY6_9ERIC|nr:E3 ubiquitin-protein ligase RHF2A [Camellia lanceoleosa]
MFNPSRNSTIFHHPTLGVFELQHLAVGANDAELEERIIQHLAAAAAMGRAHHHIARRDGPRRGESEPATITAASLFHLLEYLFIIEVSSTKDDCFGWNGKVQPSTFAKGLTRNGIQSN